MSFSLLRVCSNAYARFCSTCFSLKLHFVDFKSALISKGSTHLKCNKTSVGSADGDGYPKTYSHFV